MLKRLRTCVGLPFVLVVIFVAASALNVFAWGDEGHQTVARIAARKISPKTRLRLLQILQSAATDDLHLRQFLGRAGTTPAMGIDDAIEEAFAKMAIWPDHMPGGKGITSPWHFIDIGLAEGPAHINDHCAKGCVNQKISELITNLRTNQPLGAFPVDRELRFLIHFVGDIHQPLHAATDADAGGNCISVSGFTDQHELHAVWDTELVEELHTSQNDDLPTEIIAFAARVPALAQVNQQLDPVAMANESFGFARTVAYGAAKPAVPTIAKFIDVSPSKCKQEAPPQILSLVVDGPTSYVNTTTLNLVRAQLFKGGVRLAAILDAIYGR